MFFSYFKCSSPEFYQIFDAGRHSTVFTLPQVFFKSFASKNELPGFYISEILIRNELNYLLKRMAKLQRNVSTIFRSIYRRYFLRKVSLEILLDSQENTCASLFFNEVAGWIHLRKIFLQETLRKRSGVKF